MQAQPDQYKPKTFEHLNLLKGISKETTNLHYKLYEGYVKKLNEINCELKTVERQNANHNYSHHRELLIEKTHNLNSIVLHELFFTNITGDETKPGEQFKKVIEKDFELWEDYKADIKATAKSARAGWAVTAFNHRNGKIDNFAIDLHDIHVPAFVRPLLVIDVWEHAYTTDYGIDKAAYIDAIWEIINWNMIDQRLECIMSNTCSCIKKEEGT